MNARAVVAEILDNLPPHDPRARRSRKDLRFIHWLMGNERWILRTLRREPALARGLTEWGAGDGHLVRRIALAHPEIRVTAHDLVPPPAGLPRNVEWRQGDLLDDSAACPGGVLVVNLFLHHFHGDALAVLAARAALFDAIIFNEPLRAPWPHLLGWLLGPLLSPVTRHDLHASLRAGFVRGEMSALLKLGPRDEGKTQPGSWRWRERVSWSGAVRLHAWKS